MRCRFIISFAVAVVTAHLNFSSPVMAADPDKGEVLWTKCRSCHEIGPGAEKKVGPPLNNILGRVAGSSDRFIYSKAMIAAGEDGLIWTEETLHQFLERPKSFIKKTRMSFSGLRKQQERDDLIAFLQLYSDDKALPTRNAHLQAADPDLPASVLATVGDKDYGEYLSGTCVGCHQIGGADLGIPSIIGWPKDAFMTVMFSYRSKFRENPVMQQIAGSLNNEEIAALAAYFEDQKQPQ